MGPHPGENTVAEFVDGILSAEPRARVVAHIEFCGNCRRAVACSMAASPRWAAVTPGRTLGRYVLGRMIGRGAMGVVHAGYDPALERNVALKLVRTEAPLTPGSAGRARLVREARAMARVNHPNVVTIYDVGTADDMCWLAMELVEGATLRIWAVEARPDGEAIIRAYLGAGRGLLAAHETGLVHRDFKPDNVLVARDGRVLVTDFGLALDAGVPGVPADDEDVSTAVTVTRAGTLVGTPAYMAPEQRAGAPIDARADQYSFCVSLFEALTGERPRRGRPGPEPRLPALLDRALRRGLESDPDDRHPTLEPLLDVLEDTVRGRRRRRVP